MTIGYSEIPAGGSVKSAVRVLELFEHLAHRDAAKTHTEIADQLEIPKSSLTQLLKTLVKKSYLTYDPATKRYALGPAIAELARKSMEASDIRTLAGPVLYHLSETTAETCALNVLKGDFSEVVLAIVSSQRLVYTMTVGDSAPLHLTSGGKALLAFLPAEARQDYISRVKLEAVTPNSIISKDQLAQQLDEIARTGIAYVYEEYTPGIVGMGRPILSEAGFPVGSINVAVPTTRFNSRCEIVCVEALDRAVSRLRAQILALYSISEAGWNLRVSPHPATSMLRSKR